MFFPHKPCPWLFQTILAPEALWLFANLDIKHGATSPDLAHWNSLIFLHHLIWSKPKPKTHFSCSFPQQKWVAITEHSWSGSHFGLFPSEHQLFPYQEGFVTEGLGDEDPEPVSGALCLEGEKGATEGQVPTKVWLELEPESSNLTFSWNKEHLGIVFLLFI